MKKFIPALATGAIILIIGAGAYFATAGKHLLTGTPSTGTGTTTDVLPQGIQVSGAGTSSPGGGARVDSQEVVAVGFEKPDWKVRFYYKPEWTFRHDESYNTILIDAPTVEFGIQKNKPIAPPALAQAVTRTETIAGQSTTVTRYTGKDTNFVFYEFFTITVGGEPYYFAVWSKSEDTAPVKEFTDSIEIK